MGLIEGKYKQIRSGNYISVDYFKAYDKDMSEFWFDDHEPQVEQIELRCLDICHTSVIDEIKILKLNN